MMNVPSPVRRLVTATSAVIWLVSAPASAQDGMVDRADALALMFPDAGIEAERLFLTADQLERIAALAGSPLPSPLVARYLARRDGREIGRAYVDTHVVRTKRESLLISLDPDGRVQRVDVTAFLEPPEYVATRRWRQQFEGGELSDELQLHRHIRSIAGATLTARAATDAVRRVLAIDRVLRDDAREDRP